MTTFEHYKLISADLIRHIAAALEVPPITKPWTTDSPPAVTACMFYISELPEELALDGAIALRLLIRARPDICSTNAFAFVAGDSPVGKFITADDYPLN